MDWFGTRFNAALAEVEKLRAEVAALRKLLTKCPTVDEFDRERANRIAAEESLRKRLAEHANAVKLHAEMLGHIGHRIDAIEQHIRQCVGHVPCDLKSELRKLLDACDGAGSIPETNR